MAAAGAKSHGLEAFHGMLGSRIVVQPLTVEVETIFIMRKIGGTA